MRNKLITLLIFMIFVILMLAAWILYGRLGINVPLGLKETALPSNPDAASDAASESEAPPPKNAAPDFMVTAADGSIHHLSDFLGTPVVLNFWASWCGPCKNEMPAFEAAYQEYGDEVSFMMVNLTDNVRETTETASAFLAKTDYTFPVYFDSAYEAAFAYDTYAIPVTYFIDTQGSIVAMGQGSLTIEYIQRGIDLILPQA